MFPTCAARDCRRRVLPDIGGVTRHVDEDFAVFHVKPIEKLGLCLSDYPHVLMDINQIPTGSQSLNGHGLVCDRDKEILLERRSATHTLGRCHDFPGYGHGATYRPALSWPLSNSGP